MDATTLGDFRQGLYACFTRAGDALFEVADALLTDSRARSLVALSQAPGFRRQWSRLYAALQDGRLDRAALRRLFARHAPQPAPGQRLLLGLDTRPIHRPEAHTLADRTLVYAPNLPAGASRLGLLSAGRAPRASEQLDRRARQPARPQPRDGHDGRRRAGGGGAPPAGDAADPHG